MSVVDLPLARSSERTRTTAWWGVAMVILTESTVFAILLAAYFFLRAASTAWPPPGVELPDLKTAVPASFLLWGSSLPIFAVEAAARRGRWGVVRAGLLVSWLMGATFVAITLKDFQALHFGWRDHAYGSIFYTIVGLHALHLVVGLSMSLVVQAKSWLGRYSPERHASLGVFSLYWHFVDLVWLAVFPSLFLSVRWR